MSCVTKIFHTFIAENIFLARYCKQRIILTSRRSKIKFIKYNTYVDIQIHGRLEYIDPSMWLVSMHYGNNGQTMQCDRRKTKEQSETHLCIMIHNGDSLGRGMRVNGLY